MAIEWTPRLAVGIPSIDMQHRELFDRVNALLAAMEAKRGESELGRVVVFLGDYVVTHFGAEERLMQQHGYPDFPAHKLAHATFVKDFERLRGDLARTGPSPAAAVALNQRVCAWLIDHIGRTDRALGAFLATKMSARPQLS
ncbi:MAG TPA: bacteriohemerythrin [Anaeromyxobacteraceae bacterium]|nr:bacteriohemerythrin [Anaeromyxobacteraceae bacterium]